MKLVCPAGNLPSLKAAVDNGADAVYIGFRDSTNARHFAGLNFTDAQIEKGLQYARNHQVKVFVAINTYPYPSDFTHWQNAVDRAAGLGVDALILADIGVMDYARERWPDLNLHLSVQSLSGVLFPLLRVHISGVINLHSCNSPSLHHSGISFSHEHQSAAVSYNIINSLEIAVSLRSSQ